MTKQSAARRTDALRKLRRDILSSKVLVALDEKEGKSDKTPHDLKVLSRLNLPLLEVTSNQNLAYAKKVDIDKDSKGAQAQAAHSGWKK